MTAAKKAAIGIGLMVVVIVGGILITNEIDKRKAKSDRKDFVEKLIQKEYPGHVLLEYAVQTKNADGKMSYPTICGWVSGEMSGPRTGEPIAFLFKAGSYEAQRPLEFTDLLECVVWSNDKSVERHWKDEQARFIEKHRVD